MLFQLQSHVFPILYLMCLNFFMTSSSQQQDLSHKQWNCVYLSEYHSGPLLVQWQRRMMNFSEMTFEMTGDENPQIRDYSSQGLQSSLLSVKLAVCKDAATWTAPKSIHHCRPWNSLAAKSIQNFRLPDNKREFYLLFYFANVTFKSNEKNCMSNFSMKLSYNFK